MADVLDLDAQHLDAGIDLDNSDHSRLAQISEELIDLADQYDSNIANLVVHTDFNCLSVMEYAIEALKIKHVIVCGHYGCGGVQAALRNLELGLIDNWLRHVRDVHGKHETALNRIADESKRWDKLCELNVIEQVHNVCNTTIVQRAWKNGQQLAVHGWIYSLQDGLLRDLNVCTTNTEESEPIYNTALEAIYSDYAAGTK